MIHLGEVPIQSTGWAMVKGKRVVRKYNFTVHVEVAVAFGLYPAPMTPHVLAPGRLSDLLMAEHQFLMSLLKKK
jgi:hypothetical protein